jgi:hypothetical protein
MVESSTPTVTVCLRSAASGAASKEQHIIMCRGSGAMLSQHFIALNAINDLLFSDCVNDPLQVGQADDVSKTSASCTCACGTPLNTPCPPQCTQYCSTIWGPAVIQVPAPAFNMHDQQHAAMQAATA